MSTPLYNALRALAAQNTARFHMPGHKGQPAFRALTRFLRSTLPKLTAPAISTRPKAPSDKPNSLQPHSFAPRTAIS